MNTAETGAVFEHTAHSAITTARAISAMVATDYDSHAQVAAELRLADADLMTILRGDHDDTGGVL